MKTPKASHSAVPQAAIEDVSPQQTSAESRWVAKAMESLVASIATQPTYALFGFTFLILFLVTMRTGVPTSGPLGSIPGYLMPTFLGLLSLVSCTPLLSKAIKDFRESEKSQTSNDHQPPIDPTFSPAFDRFVEQCQGTLVKQHLAFEFEIEAGDPIRAKLHGSYQVQNKSVGTQNHRLLIQIDVAREIIGSVSATLTIRDQTGARVSDETIKLLSAQHQSGLRFVYERFISIPPGKTYSITWHTDPYPIDFPYAEFWATAHPVNGMKVTFHIPSNLNLRASAEPFRTGVGNEEFSIENVGTMTIFHGHGPFLPYQGLFIRMMPSRQLEGGI